MTKFCSECGGTLGEGAAFCGSCGVAVLSLEPMHVPDQNPIGASPSRSHKSAIWVAAAIIGLIVLFALVALPKQADVGSTNNTISAAAPVTSFFGNKKLANEENFRTALADIRPMDSCLKVNMRNVPSVERINFMGGVFDGYPIFMVLAEHGYVERVENPANKDVVVYAVSPAQ